MLRILFQQADGQFEESKTTIDPPIFPMDTFVTHGAFAPHMGTSVLLSTYDNSKCLRVFQINVVFGKKAAPGSDPAEKLKVDFEIRPLAFNQDISPSPADPYGNDGATAAGVPGEQYALTHLEMLPMVQHDANIRTVSSPTVFAVFSLIGPQYHGTSSIVCRWHVREGPESVLLPVWDQLPRVPLKKKASDAAPRVRYTFCMSY
jgi:Mediator complex subunit 16